MQEDSNSTLSSLVTNLRGSQFTDELSEAMQGWRYVSPRGLYVIIYSCHGCSLSRPFLKC